MLYVREDGKVVFHRETEPFGLHSKRRLTPNAYTHVAASFGFGKTAIFINGSVAGRWLMRRPVEIVHSPLTHYRRLFFYYKCLRECMTF